MHTGSKHPKAIKSFEIEVFLGLALTPLQQVKSLREISPKLNRNHKEPSLAGKNEELRCWMSAHLQHVSVLLCASSAEDVIIVYFLLIATAAQEQSDTA